MYCNLYGLNQRYHAVSSWPLALETPTHNNENLLVSVKVIAKDDWSAVVLHRRTLSTPH